MTTPFSLRGSISQWLITLYMYIVTVHKMYHKLGEDTVDVKAIIAASKNNIV